MSHTYGVSKRTYLFLTRRLPAEAAAQAGSWRGCFSSKKYTRDGYIFLTRYLRLIVLLGMGSCFLTASSCPTSEPFPPPPARAPFFIAMQLEGIKISDDYRTAVHVQWDLRGKDSIPVSQFVILRKKQSIDTVFSVMHYAIPDTVFDDYDVLLQGDMPAQGVFSKIWYRIFAIDTLGRSGDTSAADSIQMCWAPRIGYPEDTLKQNLFKWYTIQYMAGYFTYLYLWNATKGLWWMSPKPNEPSYGHETLDSFFVQLPDTLYPLTPGTYWYGLKVEIPGENIQSLAIQEFHAP